MEKESNISLGGALNLLTLVVLPIFNEAFAIINGICLSRRYQRASNLYLCSIYRISLHVHITVHSMNSGSIWYHIHAPSGIRTFTKAERRPHSPHSLTPSHHGWMAISNKHRSSGRGSGFEGAPYLIVPPGDPSIPPLI